MEIKIYTLSISKKEEGLQGVFM